MPESASIDVTVVYAGRDDLFSVTLSLAPGATVADAIARSGLSLLRPDAEPREGRIGIFSRKVSLTTPLRDGDRVEIYRPLTLDPKQARRERARAAAAPRSRSRPATR